MGSSEKRNKAYKKQLEGWIAKTGWQKSMIAALTKYFQFDAFESVNLDAPGLTRLIAKRPVYRPGLHNLFGLLGVLYTLGVASKEDLAEFLEQHMDNKFPPNEDWQSTWSSIEAGNLKCKENEDLTIANNIKPKRKTVWYLYGTVFAFLAMVIVLGIILYVNNSKGELGNCTTPIDSTAPVFSRQAGFSHYLTNSNDIEAGLMTNAIRSIEIDNDGIWVGYIRQENGFDGISYLNKETRQWTHCSGLGLEAGQNINDIEILDDAVYVATDGAGVSVLQDGQWQHFGTEHGLPSNFVYDIFIKNDNVFAATFNGFAKLDRAHWQSVYTSVNQDTLSRIHNVFDDSHGNRWFGHIDRGITRITPAGEFLTYFQDEVGLQSIRGIAEDQLGAVWFATDGGGVIRFFDEEWIVYSISTGHLINDNTQDVEVDFLGRVWIATQEGALYSPDHGETWIQHTTINTWGIELGCEACSYHENHIWYVFREGGLGHSQLPPQDAIVEIIDTPTTIALTTGESYRFEVIVQVISEDLGAGDSLINIDSEGTDLFGAYHTIPVVGDVLQGETYTFSNANDPIIAPDEPSIYTTTWRVWQSTRFVSDPIVIEFEVRE